MVNVFILLIDRDLNKQEFNNLLQYVSKNKKKLIYEFHYYKDAQRMLLGDILARHAICKKLDIDNKHLIFGNNKYGKPLLAVPSGVYYNISHSGNWVVCAIDNLPIGIDVEVIKPIDMMSIAERFFAKKEYIAFRRQTDDRQLEYFYRIWTLKESYIKKVGKGLNIPLRSFTINIGNDNSQINLININCKYYYFYQSGLTNNSIYAVCASTNQFSKRINLNIRSLLHEVML